MVSIADEKLDSMGKSYIRCPKCDSPTVTSVTGWLMDYSFWRQLYRYFVRFLAFEVGIGIFYACMIDHTDIFDKNSTFNFIVFIPKAVIGFIRHNPDIPIFRGLLILGFLFCFFLYFPLKMIFNIVNEIYQHIKSKSNVIGSKDTLECRRCNHIFSRESILP
jgi:uncharacterized C2H2 Zn-finger protein